MADLKFNKPHEQVKAGTAKAVAAATVSPAPLDGTWKNCDKHTPNLVKVVIRSQGDTLFVHAYGACHPTPCDWGEVKGLAYASSVAGGPAVAFSALYSFGFKDTILTGYLDGASLVVEDFNTFKDGSGRANYYTREHFCKE
jgi:hypothetical protein